MADPPAGPPEPLATTSTQGTAATDTSESLEPTAARRTRRQTRAEDDQAHTSPLITESTTSGRVTTKEIRQTIEQLQHIINKQTVLIQVTRTELREVKANQNELHAQNEKLQEEVQALRAQIDGLNAPALTRSWATVVANSDNTEPRKNHQRTEKEKNCVRISTQRSPVDSPDSEDNANAFGRYLATPIANSFIRTALLNASPTQEVQVAGIGTTKTGYVIRFKDSVSAETARNNTEWLNELGNDTRLVKPRFGVVVHHVPTQGLDLERDKTAAIRKIMEENDLQERGFRIEDIAWLKKRDKVLGTFASMGVWFDSAEAAQWMIDNGLLLDQRYIGRVEKCEIKKKRCFRCQRFGHLAWSCKETPRCGHCGGQHVRASCPPGIRARCLDCSGEHPTGDRLCPAPVTTPSSQC